MNAGPLVLRRRPGEEPGVRFDLGSQLQRTCVQAKRVPVIRIVRVRGDGRQRQFSPFVDRPVVDRLEHGPLDRNRKRLRGFLRWRAVVDNSDCNIVGVKSNALVQHPVEEARGRVDFGPGGCSRVETECQGIHRDIGIVDLHIKREPRTPVDRHIVHGLNCRSLIDLHHRDGKGHRIAQSRVSIVGRPNREIVGAGAIFLIGYPGKLHRGRVERCSVGRALGQPHIQALGRLIGIGNNHRPQNRRAFVDAKIVDLLNHRRPVDLNQCDGKRLGVFQGRVAAVVYHDRNGISGQVVVHRRRPSQQPRLRINSHSVRRPRLKAIEQRVAGQVRINGRNRDRKRIAPIDHLVLDSLDRRRRVYLPDRNRERF